MSLNFGRALMGAHASAERQKLQKGQDAWTKEQQDLYMSGDWEAFSKSRGYTKEEIANLKSWIKMKEDGEKQRWAPLEIINDLNVEVF